MPVLNQKLYIVATTILLKYLHALPSWVSRSLKLIASGAYIYTSGLSCWVDANATDANMLTGVLLETVLKDE